MNDRKAAEKKCDERGSEEKAKDDKPENLAKKLKGLTLSEGIVKGVIVATAAAAIISSNKCTTEFDTPDRDVADDVDAVEADVEADDIPADVDTDADGIADVDIDDVGVEDEVTLVCTPFNESRTVTIGTDSSMNVGGIDIMYKGLDGSDNAVYDIICEGVVVRSDVTVAIGSSETVNVPEQGFDVTLDVDNAYDWNTRVIVTVETI